MVAQLVKNPPAGDPDSIPGSGTSSPEGIDYPLQYSWASLVATSACKGSVGDLESIPGLERYPAEENGYSIEDSGLENSTDRGAWWTPWGSSPWGRQESDTTERLSHGQAGALVFSQFSAQPLESCRVCETSRVGPPLTDALVLSNLRGKTPARPPGTAPQDSHLAVTALRSLL